MDSTVTTVESFRLLGTTISKDLKWDTHIDSIVKKAQQRLYFLRQLRKYNLPQELLKRFYSAIIESVLCTSITVWFSSATKSDIGRLHRVVQLAKSLWTPHTQHTSSLNCCRLVDATEHRAPERPDTGTVSSLRQSILWTLDNNCGTHNTIYTLIYLTHLHLHFKFAHNIPVHTKLSIVIYLYIQLSIWILLFPIYLFYFILLLSVFLSRHCHSVAMWKLPSRKPIPRMCKHTWE